MKFNISSVLNIVLLVAVGYLYYLNFSSSDTKKNSEKKTQESTIEPNSNSIVYVEYDSILTQYNMVSDMQEELLSEKTKMETRLQIEVENYKKEVQTFQERAPYFSDRQRQIEQESLLNKEQEIMQLEQNLNYEFADRQSALNDKLETKLQDLFKSNEFSNQHIMIFGKGVGSNLLFANSGLNITKQVIEKLNDDYSSTTKVED